MGDKATAASILGDIIVGVQLVLLKDVEQRPYHGFNPALNGLVAGWPKTNTELENVPFGPKD